MKKPPTSILFSVTLAFAFLITGCGEKKPVKSSHQKVVFGAILPLTGSAAQYGEEARQGIEVAIQHLRDQPGKRTYEFAYEVQDSASDPKNAESAFRVLRARNNVPAVVSEVSGIVLALAPICEREQTVLVNVGAQNPKIAGAGRFIFSNVNLADVESKQIAEFAYTILGKRKAAVLFASASYGQGARDVFVQRFKELGGEIVADTSYPVESTDYRAQITEVSRANPEVVYLPGTTKDMARVLRQSQETGFRPQWLSYTAFEGEEMLSLAGNAAEGVIFASAYLDWQNSTGLQAQFRDAYKTRFQKIPSVYAATSFDAILLLADAVHARGPNALTIRDYLINMQLFAGASGITRFAPNGTVNKPLIFKTVTNRAFVVYQQKL